MGACLRVCICKPMYYVKVFLIKIFSILLCIKCYLFFSWENFSSLCLSRNLFISSKIAFLLAWSHIIFSRSLLDIYRIHIDVLPLFLILIISPSLSSYHCSWRYILYFFMFFIMFFIILYFFFLLLALGLICFLFFVWGILQFWFETILLFYYKYLKMKNIPWNSDLFNSTDFHVFLKIFIQLKYLNQIQYFNTQYILNALQVTF